MVANAVLILSMILITIFIFNKLGLSFGHDNDLDFETLYQYMLSDKRMIKQGVQMIRLDNLEYRWHNMLIN